MVRRTKSFQLFVGTTAAFLAMQAHAQDSDLVADEIVVEGSQVELTEPNSGGQVASGGRAGLLGNNQYSNLPFSGTAYTSDFIAEQQAASVGDVLLNDPTVRVANGFGNFQEVYKIRGFAVFSDDITFNGVYGILPRQVVAAPLVERVEVLRGANAFINGAAPGGSGVGGIVNIVPKRAPEEGVTSLTLGYESTGQFFGTVDFGRRFGAESEWGLRLGATGRFGETSVDDADQTLTALSVGIDYDGDRARFNADLGYQNNELDAPRPQVTPFGEVPTPPDADTNYAQPWTFSEEQQLYFATRGELDLTDEITAWLAGGFRFGDEANSLANPNADADGNLTTIRFDNVREDTVYSVDGGVRAEFETGPIDHQLVLSGSLTHQDFKNAFAFSNFFAPSAVGTLDNPVAIAPPAADFFLGGDFSNPLTTEETSVHSFAIADTLGFFDESLLLTLGVRYQNITTKAFDVNTGELSSEADASAFTPAAGIVFKPTDALSLYANYAEALQRPEVAPDVSGAVAVVNAGETFGPFRSRQFEIGGKYDAGDFGVELSLFQITQSSSIIENGVFSDNGEQRNRGIELTFFGEPMEGLRILGGGTLIDASLQNTQDGLNEGNDAVGVPNFQANLGVQYDLPFVPGMTVGGDLFYTGEQWVDAANTFKADSWTRLDLGASYEVTFGDTDLILRATVENVANSAYWESVGGFPGANYLVQGEPRTFVASATINF